MSDIEVMLCLTKIISNNIEDNRNYYYDVSKKFLWMVGQWPYQKPKTRLSFFALLVTTLIICIFTQVTLSTKEFFRYSASLRFDSFRIE